jgi:transcriptional regulator with XRE-family HTH domain
MKKQEFNKEIGCIFRTMRGDLRQRDIAELLGVSQQYYGNVERGTDPISLQKAVEWSKKMGFVMLIEGGEVKAYKNAGD